MSNLKEWHKKNPGKYTNAFSPKEPRSKTHDEIIAEAVRIHGEIHQYYDDIDHWNESVRKPNELFIDPDPDGVMKVVHNDCVKIMGIECSRKNKRN